MEPKQQSSTKNPTWKLKPADWRPRGANVMEGRFGGHLALVVENRSRKQGSGPFASPDEGYEMEISMPLCEPKLYKRVTVRDGDAAKEAALEMLRTFLSSFVE